jgi:tRNA pseudouridine38-40 synthase
MTERNIKLVVEYEGTAYSGWQVQPGQDSIQGQLESAVHKVTGRTVSVTGAGRTDAGVHALGQVANFVAEHALEPQRYKDALNYYLPDDIRVKETTEVALDFNARRHAVWKRYRYLVGLEKSAIYRHLRWELTRPILPERLRTAARMIVGEHDFAPFCVVSSRKANNVCVIHSAVWRRIGGLLVFEIRGNRFLHNMVRVLVGAMVNIAEENPDNNKQNLTLERFADIIKAANDNRVVFTAPAQGLYLVSVHYDKEVAE